MEMRFKVLTGWTLFCCMFVGCSCRLDVMSRENMQVPAAKSSQLKPTKIGTAQGIPVYTMEIDGKMYYAVPAEATKTTGPDSFNPFDVPKVEKPDKEL